LIPSGATFSVAGTSPVSVEVKAVPRKALPAKHKAKK